MHHSLHPSPLLRKGAVVWAALLLITVGCSSSLSAVPPTAVPEAQPVVNVTISGSSISMGIITAIQPAFEAAQSGTHLDVLVRSGAGTSAAPTIQGVADNKLDIAAVSRPTTPEEQALGVESAEVGRTSTAIITHAGIDIKNLTADQVRSIFNGTITNWSEVSGPKLPIVVFVRTEDNASTDAVRKGIFGKTAFVKQSQVIDKSDQLQVALEGTPGGIAYAGWTGKFIKSTGLHSIMLDGVGPTDASYPVSQPVVLCFRAEHKAEVQPLIDWLHTDAGKAALSKIGVIPAK
jgi:phosphate transport system substrate-binding protein